MDLKLDGRKALVSAASRGLGLAIARGLAGEGVQVMICGRDRGRLDKAVGAIEPVSRHPVLSTVCDLDGPDAGARLGREAFEQLGQVDILVNNTGGPPPGPVSQVEPEAWRKHFSGMAESIFALTGTVLPGMRERGFGRILNVISSGVIQPIPVLGISNAVRASIVGWAKTLSLEVASDGVTINSLAPGRIATERVTELDTAAAKRQGISMAEVEEQARAAIPAGRYGDPAEFAAVATFLAGAGAGYVTGSVIRIDGGAVKSI